MDNILKILSRGQAQIIFQCIRKKKGPFTALEVQVDLRNAGHNITISTIRGVIRVLVNRGYITEHKEDRGGKSGRSVLSYRFQVRGA